MDLISILKDKISPELIGQLSQQVGATPEQTSTATDGILSTLVGALSKNAASPEGASLLSAALDKDHDGSVLDDIMGMVTGGGAAANSPTTNGAGILGHILGGQQGGVSEMIGKMAGMNSGSAGNLMTILAPMVMGALGQAKQQQGLDASGLAGLLGGTVQNQQQSGNAVMGMVSMFLDKDKDGSVVDDLFDMGKGLLGSFMKK